MSCSAAGRDTGLLAPLILVLLASTSPPSDAEDDVPKVQATCMLSGAMVADGFDGPALDAQTWHRPDWLVKNDPGISVAVEEGRLRIAGVSRPTGRHHQYTGVLSTYFRETDVVVAARLRVASSFDKPGRIRHLVHLCTGDWPDFFSEIDFGMVGAGPPRWHAGYLDRIWEYSGYEKYLDPTLAATGKESSEWHEVVIVHDGATHATQGYVIAGGAWKPVGPSHAIKMNHSHVELKVDVSVPDVRVSAEFDDVRLYPAPAHHPVTIVVDSPLSEDRKRPAIPIDRLKVRLIDGDSRQALGEGVTDEGGQAQVTLRSDVVYPVAARIEVASESRVLVTSEISRRGVRGLYPADVWVVSLPASGGAPPDVPRFGLFERSFRQRGSYQNPYVEVSASATFLQPGGRERSIPLYWDGGAHWKVRFSPDVAGTWRWSVASNDPGLSGASGSFECVPSASHGGITAMAGYPYHFQHQDGTPFWLSGDTQWEAFADDPGQDLDADSVRRYFTLRAEAGFNYVHTEVIGLVRASNRDANGVESPAFHDYGAQTINPAYFQEVDDRVRHANALGITLGLILLEPYSTPASSIDPAYRYDNRCWMSFPDEAARLRYARYVVARYSAFNVLFLLTLEWGPRSKPVPRDQCVAMFNRIGAEVQRHDPHDRLRGIHDDNQTLPDDFYGGSSAWNTLGQYAQYSGSGYDSPWCDGCSPPNDANCRGRFATPRNRRALHDEMLEVRMDRNRNRPVIDGEYAYYLRRGDPAHPTVVNRGHSHDQATFRKAAWVLTLAGAHIVPGLWRTYYGGWGGRGTRFQPDDPEARPAIVDLQTLHGFFTRLEDGSGREWWKLVPHDELVSCGANPADGSPGQAYCLADPGRAYVVYAENTRAAELRPDGPPGAAYRVTRFDPRSATRVPLDVPAGDGKTITLVSPDTEDWVFEAVKS